MPLPQPPSGQTRGCPRPAPCPIARPAEGHACRVVWEGLSEQQPPLQPVIPSGSLPLSSKLTDGLSGPLHGRPRSWGLTAVPLCVCVCVVLTSAHINIFHQQDPGCLLSPGLPPKP